MLDLEAMRRDARREWKGKRAFKTSISDEAYDRVMASAEFVGCFVYELIERLIMENLPPVIGGEQEEDQ